MCEVPVLTSLFCVFGFCMTTLWIAALVVLFCVFKKAFYVLFGLLALYFGYQILRACCAVEVHTAENAAETMFAKKHGKTPDLPEKLQGVWWMSTNAAPELITSFEGQWFSAEKRMINFDSGGNYAWTHSTGCFGWIYWFFLRCSFMWCSELHFYFSDEEYTRAEMPLYVCGCCKDGSCCDGCKVPMGQWWTMEQREGDVNTWDRNIYLYCMPWKRWELGSYVLRRIIDEKGNKLPAFEEMVEQVHSSEKVKGITSKPVMQIMNGDDWQGYLLFGSRGNPDLELEKGLAAAE